MPSSGSRRPLSRRSRPSVVGHSRFRCPRCMFYRALMSTAHRWTPQQWTRPSRNFNPRPTLHQSSQSSCDRHRTTRRNRPRGHSICYYSARSLRPPRSPLEWVLMCCVIKVQWTVLIQASIPLDLDAEEFHSSEAAAANNARASLLRSSFATVAKADKGFATALESSKEFSLECFREFREFPRCRT